MDEPKIVFTLLASGDISFQMKGGWPPGTLFTASQLLARVGNKMMDETDAQQELARQMITIPKDMKRNV